MWLSGNVSASVFLKNATDGGKSQGRVWFKIFLTEVTQVLRQAYESALLWITPCSLPGKLVYIHYFTIFTIATRHKCNSSSQRRMSSLTLPRYHWWNVLVLHLFIHCLIITLLNLWRQKTQMKSGNGVISFLKRAAPPIPYRLRWEWFYDLGNAVLSPSHTGADEGGCRSWKSTSVDASQCCWLSDLSWL